MGHLSTSQRTQTYATPRDDLSLTNSKCLKYGKMVIYQHIESEKIESTNGPSMNDLKY